MGFRNKDPVSVHVAREHDEYVDFVMHHLIGDGFVAHTGNVKPMIAELLQLRRCAVRLWHIGIGINLHGITIVKMQHGQYGHTDRMGKKV